MNLIQKVTIKNIIPLYRDQQLAEKVELVTFEENQFTGLVEKGLYKIGDEVAYIIPDTYISIPEDPEKDIFKDYRSKMGNKKRVRAIAFNFQTEPTEISTKIYSNGILYPNLTDLQKNLLLNEKYEELEKQLGLYKEDSDAKFTGNKTGGSCDMEFPSNIYKTDEMDIKRVPVRDLFSFPCHLNITKKYDGSSSTIIIGGSFPKGVIGSRNLLKNPYTTQEVPIKYANIFKKLLSKIGLLPRFKKETIFNTQSKDIFVQTLLPYLQKLLKSGYNNLAFRGELIGKSFKGNGNRQNLDSKKDNQWILFNIDNLIKGYAEKVDVELFYEIVDSLNLNTADCYTLDPVNRKHTREFKSYEELEKFVLNIFQELPSIEGVVIKNESNTISFKYMNDLYDSRK